MNTNQQAYYPNQPVPASYYPANGHEQAYANRYPNSYSQQMMMPQAYYQANHVHQIYDQSTMISNPGYVSTNNPRNPNSVPIIRPSNETPPGQPYNLYQPQQQMFPQPYTQYITGSMHPAPSQLQYLSQPTTQSGQTSQPPLQNPQPSQPQQASEKRQRKPLAIVDPTSHEAINMPTSISSTNATAVEDSTSSNSKAINDVTKSEQQQKFRSDFARILNPKISTDKDAKQSSTKENQPNEHFPPSTSSSRSSSISKASSEQSHPVVVSESPAEDKLPEEPIPTEPELADSKSPLTDTSFVMIDEPSPPESIDDVTPTPADDAESESVILRKTPSATKRIGYTIEELRRKQLSLLSQERPLKLIEIAGVTSPAPPPQPAKPEIDADEKFIRDVTAILNKLTPQNNDKLIDKLDKLELNSAKRLEAMISVMFVKAVEAAIFCSLYAKLCKHFQKKTVTVPDENGQPVTHFFRQLLLTRCQKEFECDYRQDIRYDDRHKDVEAIVDQKVRREAAEQLEEDLLKAKRKKLGNIIFIGELFKLQMLTDTIMYDCVEYLLRDKTDEEGLECLCKLLTNIGRELDAKSMEKHNTTNRKNLEKNYIELENLVTQRQGSARIRFMIQDLMEMRKANWVARRAEMKPLTIDEIHETERLKREQQEIDRERDRQQRRDYNRMGGGGGPPQYTESRGSRGSGMRQQSNRTDDDRADNRVIASLKQYQSSEKRNPEGTPLNFGPQRAWGKGSGVEKKAEDDRANAGRNNKPPVGGNTSYRTKTGAYPGTPGYPVQRQPSRELARENNFRPRENPKEPLRKATSVTGPSNPSNVDSRESSRNVSREESRNVSPEPAKTSTAETNSNTPLDEDKLHARVHSLIEEYTRNYSDNNDRPVNEAIEDLSSFCTADVNQQAVIVQDLFTNVLEAKSRARKAVGHLLDVALHKNTLSTEGFLSGIKMFVEVVPDYAVDIPLIWQYVAEILGAFIGAPSSNMVLLKPILQSIPEAKSKQLFQDVIQYAKEFSSEAQVRQFWQAAGFSLNDLLKVDSAFVDKYNWLNDPIEPENTAAAAAAATTVDNQTPNADSQLVQLFKSINNQGTTVTTDQILAYIQENMNSTDKYYIRNIVLSYLEACLVNRDSQRKIQEDIVKQRMTILKAIITDKVDAEVQAVYAIQNYVHKLEHPSKMAQLLFDIFYDEECVSEEAFLEWLKNPDQSETQGHSVVVMSTKDFFTWLEQADPDGEEDEVEEEEN